MNRAEKVVLGGVCLLCLAMPVALVLGGLLDAEEPVLGDGLATVTKLKPEVSVWRRQGGGTIPVYLRGEAKVPDGSGADIPIETAASAQPLREANTLPIEDRRRRGFSPVRAEE